VNKYICSSHRICKKKKYKYKMYLFNYFIIYIYLKLLKYFLQNNINNKNNIKIIKFIYIK